MFLSQQHVFTTRKGSRKYIKVFHRAWKPVKVFGKTKKCLWWKTLPNGFPENLLWFFTAMKNISGFSYKKNVRVLNMCCVKNLWGFKTPLFLGVHHLNCRNPRLFYGELYSDWGSVGILTNEITQCLIQLCIKGGGESIDAININTPPGMVEVFSVFNWFKFNWLEYLYALHDGNL
jgi:hypothetical protein